MEKKLTFCLFVQSGLPVENSPSPAAENSMSGKISLNLGTGGMDLLMVVGLYVLGVGARFKKIYATATMPEVQKIIHGIIFSQQQKPPVQIVKEISALVSHVADDPSLVMEVLPTGNGSLKPPVLASVAPK